MKEIECTSMDNIVSHKKTMPKNRQAGFLVRTVSRCCWKCPLLNIDHGFSIKTSKGLYITVSFSQDCLICSVLFLSRNLNTAVQGKIIIPLVFVGYRISKLGAL